MKNIAILFLIAGGLIFMTGMLLLFADKIPWLGNLPGDIQLKFKNTRIHLPLMTCFLISLVLTLLLNVLLRFVGK